VCVQHIIYRNRIGRVCECDAAAVVPAPDILLFDGRVLHAKLTYRILVQLVQATARYLLSRILYYIIITRISMCVCVCVCVCVYFLSRHAAEGEVD